MTESTADAENQTDNKPTENQSTQKQTGERDQGEPGEVTDEMLPEDVRPGEDNPLAEPLDDEDEEKGMSLGPDGPGAPA